MSGREAIMSLLATVCISLPAYSESGTRTVQELIELFSRPAPEDGEPQPYQSAAQLIDYAGMSEQLLAKSQWEHFTPAQQREITASIQSLLEQRYYERWHKLYGRGKVSYLGEKTANDNVYVSTILVLGKEKESIIWELRPRGGKLMVTDINADGKDMLARLKLRVQRHLSKDGYDGLISWLKRKSRTQS